MPTPIGLEKLRELVAAGAQLVEVLPAEAYEKAHLPDAINLPLASLREPDVDVLDRLRPVVVYCWDPL
jgi:phage shock protein E